MAGPFLTSLIAGIGTGFFDAERESALEKKKEKIKDEEKFEAAIAGVRDDPEAFDPAFVDMANRAQFGDKKSIADIKKAIALGVVSIPGQTEILPVDPGAAEPGVEALPAEQAAQQQLPSETAAGGPAFAPLEVPTTPPQERPVTVPFEEQENRRFERALSEAKQTTQAQEKIKEEFKIRAERRGNHIVDEVTGAIRQVTPEEAEGGQGINQAVALAESKRIINKQVKDTEKIKTFKSMTKILMKTKNISESEAVELLFDRQNPEDIRYQFDAESGTLLGIQGTNVWELARVPRRAKVSKITNTQLEGADTWLTARVEGYKDLDEPTKANLRAFFLQSMELEGEPLAVTEEFPVPNMFSNLWLVGKWFEGTRKETSLVSPRSGTIATPGEEIPRLGVESSPLFIADPATAGPQLISGGGNEPQVIQMDAQGNVILQEGRVIQ